MVDWLTKATGDSKKYVVNDRERSRDSGYSEPLQDEKLEDIWGNEEAICPTFAGGDAPAAECILIEPEMQEAGTSRCSFWHDCPARTCMVC